MIPNSNESDPVAPVAPPAEFCRNGLHPKAGPGRCVFCRRAANARYDRSLKGLTAKWRAFRNYRATAAGREQHRAGSKRYNGSEKGRARNARYNEKRRVKDAAWWRREFSE